MMGRFDRDPANTQRNERLDELYGIPRLPLRRALRVEDMATTITNLILDLMAKNVATSVATSGGGADPWTYIKLASDFAISTTASADVTGMAFTPAANTDYEIEGQFLIRSSATTTGPRPGIAWPAGMTDGVGSFEVSTSASAQNLRNGNINADFRGAGTAFPSITQSFPVQMKATLLSGATPSGDFKITLASEIAASAVTLKAGSWIKYRAI